MRVLVWSINYAPEATGIAPCNVALCEYLLSQGHEVEMVTTFAYYPMWAKRPEDCGLLYRTDMLNGVPVHRCWHYVPAKVKAWKRIVHEASFVVTSFVRVLSCPRPDVMVVVSPPLLLGAAAWLVSVFRRVPFLFHVQDLQPDAAIGLGMLKTGAVSRVLYGLEALAYRAAARVSGITQGMLTAFTRKGVPKEKQRYLPNGVALPDLSGLPLAGHFRQRLGIPPEALLAVYSGNLGVKQGLPILIEAAALCKEPRVQVVICGDGAEREALAARVAECGLKNVRLVPLQDRQGYEEMLVDADLCLITQQVGTGQFFFPSKLLTTLAFRKPVLA
ncbi:MAG: glycosyltransferase WbuB, partial [Verrucomicrobiaceae bacterium]